jgi:hypothetical protein
VKLCLLPRHQCISLEKTNDWKPGVRIQFLAEPFLGMSIWKLEPCVQGDVWEMESFVRRLRMLACERSTAPQVCGGFLTSVLPKNRLVRYTGHVKFFAVTSNLVFKRAPANQLLVVLSHRKIGIHGILFKFFLDYWVLVRRITKMRNTSCFQVFIPESSFRSVRFCSCWGSSINLFKRQTLFWSPWVHD